MNKNSYKDFIRIATPKLYSFLYKLKFLKIIKNKDIYKTKEDFIRYKKIPTFTKRGFYDFFLEDISFKICLDPRNGAVDQEIYCFGVFENGILRIIKDNLKQNSCFLDIGSNIGQHALYAAHFAKEVIAFEPIKYLAHQIFESLNENEIYNVRIFNIALGDMKEDNIPIYSSGHNVGASSLAKGPGQFLSDEIKIRRLDDVIVKLDVTNIDLIKIDVEGFEYEVLKGSIDLIKKYNPKIILEFSPYIYKSLEHDNSKNIYDFLIEHKYIIYNIGVGEKMDLVTNFSDIQDCGQTNLLCISSKV